MVLKARQRRRFLGPMSSDTAAVRHRIKEILVERLNLEGTTPEMIGDETVLWGEELGLDSVDALELMIALEEEYGFRIDSEEVDQDDLATVARLEKLIAELRAGQPKVVAPEPSDGREDGRQQDKGHP